MRVMVYKGKFFDRFEEIEDHREEAKVIHKLLDVIFIVAIAVICACNEWKEVHLWATRKTNIEWLKKYIELPNGIPSLSTIGRLFNYVCPKQFEKCFIQWMKNAKKDWAGLAPIGMALREVQKNDHKSLESAFLTPV